MPISLWNNDLASPAVLCPSCGDLNASIRMVGFVGERQGVEIISSSVKPRQYCAEMLLPRNVCCVLCIAGR